jgi:RNA ligase (TIGR02306 family)
MSFEVRIHRIEVFGHPNADALELAQVGLFRAVVRKGDYVTGDYALYIPEAAVLPDPLIEELGLTGRLAGAAKNRVKAVRLRGELSQGIVCRPGRVTESNCIKGDWVNAIPGDELIDWADTLGIHKYEPPIPVYLAGKVRPQTRLLPWGDIENIKKRPDMFTPGEMVYATEKIHGTCCLVTWDNEAKELLVSSKGLAKQGLCLQRDETNTYWRAVIAAGVEEVLRDMADRYDATRIALFGEVYGAGIQDLAYGHKGDEGPQFRAFDLCIEEDGDTWWAATRDMETLFAAFPPNGGPHIRTVPVLYEGHYDYDTIAHMAGGTTVVGRGAHIREGVVVRPVPERRDRNGRVIAKFINPDYLVRKGDTTEFE